MAGFEPPESFGERMNHVRRKIEEIRAIIKDLNASFDMQSSMKSKYSSGAKSSVKYSSDNKYK